MFTVGLFDCTSVWLWLGVGGVVRVGEDVSAHFTPSQRRLLWKMREVHTESEEREKGYL